MKKYIRKRKKQNISERLLEELIKINYLINKNKILDLIELTGNTKKIILKNFTSGIVKGIGVGIGFSIITATILYLLQKIIKLNIPLISKYIADIVDLVNIK